MLPTGQPPPDADQTNPDNSEQDIQPAGPEQKPPPVEVGGPKGLEPTRYGDWERNGRCSDF